MSESGAEPPSLADLKPERPEPECLVGGEPPSRAPRCCACSLIALVLLAGGLLWLYTAAFPSHAKNGARILSHDPETLDAENYESLALRFREGRLQVVSAAGHLWEQDEAGVLRPAFGLAEPGVYLWPNAIEGDLIGLPAGQELRVLNLATGELDTLPLEATGVATTTATRGDLLAAGSELDPTVRLFEVSEARRLWKISIAPNSTTCLSFVGDVVAAGTDRGEVVLIGRAGEKLRTMDTLYQRVTAVAGSADGSHLAVACRMTTRPRRKGGGAVLVWDLSSGSSSPASSFSLDDTLLDEVSALGISADGSYVAAGRSKGALQVWDSSGTLVGEFLHDDSPLHPASPVTGIAFEGERVAWAAGEQVFVREFGK